jgi:hypothetical protein
MKGVETSYSLGGAGSSLVVCGLSAFFLFVTGDFEIKDFIELKCTQ